MEASAATNPDRLPPLEEDINPFDKKLRELANKLTQFKEDRIAIFGEDALPHREKEILRLVANAAKIIKIPSATEAKDVKNMYERIISALQGIRNAKFKDPGDWFETKPSTKKTSDLPPVYDALEKFTQRLEADLKDELVPKDEIASIVDQRIATHDRQLKFNFMNAFREFGALLLQSGGEVSAERMNQQAEQAGLLQILGTGQVFTGSSPRAASAGGSNSNNDTSKGPTIEEVDASPSEAETDVTNTYVTGEKGKAVVAVVKYQHKTKSAVEKLMCDFLRTKLMLHKNAKYIPTIIDEAKAYFSSDAVKITLGNYSAFAKMLEAFKTQSPADKANALLTDDHYLGFIYLVEGKKNEKDPDKFVTNTEDTLAKTLFEEAKKGNVAEAEKTYDAQMAEKLLAALQIEQKAPVGFGSLARKLSTENGGFRGVGAVAADAVREIQKNGIK